MDKESPDQADKKKVSIRVLLSEEDYEALGGLAKLERTKISTLVRRAVAWHFFIPGDSNTVKQ